MQTEWSAAKHPICYPSHHGRLWSRRLLLCYAILGAQIRTVRDFQYTLGDRECRTDRHVRAGRDREGGGVVNVNSAVSPQVQVSLPEEGSAAK